MPETLSYHELEVNRAFEVIERVVEVTPSNSEKVQDNRGFLLERGGQVNVELHDGTTVCICGVTPGHHYRMRVRKILETSTITEGRLYLVPAEGS